MPSPKLSWLAVFLCAGCGPGLAEIDQDDGEETLEAALVTLNRPAEVTVTVLAAAHTLRLQWTDTNSNESLSAIERSTGTPRAFSRVGKVAANVTTFDDVFDAATWALGRSYDYRVRARAANGDLSRYSVVVTASTDTQAPTMPSGLHLVSTTETTIAIAWAGSTDEVGVHHYQVFRDGQPIAQSTSTAFTDSGLWPHSTHTYYVSAVDAAGNASAISALITGYTNNDITAPSAPGPVVATFDRASISVKVSWGASTDNVRVDHYLVLRNLEQIGSVPANQLSWVDTAPPQNATVKYSVTAVDELGNVEFSKNQPQVVTDVVSPTQPTALHVTSTTVNSISLAWTASTDNFAVQSYDLYRDGVWLANQSAGLGPIWYLGSLPSGTTYRFKLVARDPTGNSSIASNEMTASTN